MSHRLRRWKSLSMSHRLRRWQYLFPQGETTEKIGQSFTLFHMHSHVAVLQAMFPKMGILVSSRGNTRKNWAEFPLISYVQPCSCTTGNVPKNGKGLLKCSTKSYT
jgi:hypothetical protein